MWIVYISIAVIIGSLAYLGFMAFKTMKAAKPTINELNHTMAKVQQKVDTIKVESTKLTENQQEIMDDIDYKKEAVTFTVEAGKRTYSSFKKLWKVRPIAKILKKRKRNPAY